jgi:hypothetical protein
MKPAGAYCVHLRDTGNFAFCTVNWFDPLTGLYSPEEHIPGGLFVSLRSPWKERLRIAVIHFERP